MSAVNMHISTVNVHITLLKNKEDEPMGALSTQAFLKLNTLVCAEE